MQLNGCFGSSLAHAPTSATCAACPALTACGDVVRNRYPLLMRLLARFSDSRGVPVAEQWLSPTDKRRLKAVRKDRAQREAELATFGDPAMADRIRASLDKRAVATLDRFIEKRVNPITASHDAIASVTRPLLSMVTALKASPQHRAHLERCIAADSALSAASAHRETSAILSLLSRCGRITSKNKIVEIK